MSPIVTTFVVGSLVRCKAAAMYDGPKWKGCMGVKATLEGTCELEVVARTLFSLWFVPRILRYAVVIVNIAKVKHVGAGLTNGRCNVFE
jgi:hypothetical protein